MDDHPLHWVVLLSFNGLTKFVMCDPLLPSTRLQMPSEAPASQPPARAQSYLAEQKVSAQPLAAGHAAVPETGETSCDLQPVLSDSMLILWLIHQWGVCVCLSLSLSLSLSLAMSQNSVPVQTGPRLPLCATGRPSAHLVDILLKLKTQNTKLQPGSL